MEEIPEKTRDKLSKVFHQTFRHKYLKKSTIAWRNFYEIFIFFMFFFSRKLNPSKRLRWTHHKGVVHVQRVYLGRLLSGFSKAIPTEIPEGILGAIPTGNPEGISGGTPEGILWIFSKGMREKILERIPECISRKPHSISSHFFIPQSTLILYPLDYCLLYPLSQPSILPSTLTLYLNRLP